MTLWVGYGQDAAERAAEAQMALVVLEARPGAPDVVPRRRRLARPAHDKVGLEAAYVIAPRADPRQPREALLLGREGDKVIECVRSAWSDDLTVVLEALVETVLVLDRFDLVEGQMDALLFREPIS